MAEHCSGKMETALEILVGKWKPLILFQLFNNGTMRFNELQKAMPNITKKMLTAQLRELEYHDIVHRKIYTQVPPKVEYSITEYGQKMAPLLLALVDWGTAHMQHLSELYGEDQTAKTAEMDDELGAAE